MKRLFFLCLIFVNLLIISNVEASNRFSKGRTIDGVYIKEIRPDGWKTVHTASFFKKVSNGDYVYCLEHFVAISGSSLYKAEVSNFEKILNLTTEQWDRIKKISYYGYNYGSHKSDIWYIVTQVMIWRTINPLNDVHFTDTVNGNKITTYNSYINEINKLVDSHDVKPSFNNKTLYFNNGKVNIKDTNDVLNNYISKTYGVIKDHIFSIDLDTEGIYEYDFIKGSYNYDSFPIVYVSNDSQNVLEVGNLNDVSAKVTVGFRKKSLVSFVKKGEVITDNKIEYELLDGYEFSVYSKSDITDLFGNVINKKGTEVLSFVSGESNVYEFEEGEYCLKELNNSDKYLELEDICFNTGIKEVIIINKLKKGQLKVIKKDTHNETIINGALIGIYDMSDVLLFEYLSGSEEDINLPYGEYYYKEIKAPDGYKIDDNKYEFKIENDDLIELVLYNEMDLKMPKTGVEINYIMYFVFIVIFICLFVLTLLSKKKIIKTISVILMLVLVCLFLMQYKKDKKISNEVISVTNNMGVTKKMYELHPDTFINIPSIDLIKEIRSGVTEDVLYNKIGHLNNGARLDDKVGNIVLAGHNHDSLFLNIRKLKKDDFITVTSGDFEEHYRVSEVFIVPEKEVELLFNKKDGKYITLVSCVNKEKDRYVVIGKKV